MVLSPKDVRVFISYSHEARSHDLLVQAMAVALEEEGFEVFLDVLQEIPPTNWAVHIEQVLSRADVVLCVCTPTYAERVDGEVPGGVGRGVAQEGVHGAHVPSGRVSRWIAASTSREVSVRLILFSAPASAVCRGWEVPRDQLVRLENDFSPPSSCSLSHAATATGHARTKRVVSSSATGRLKDTHDARACGQTPWLVRAMRAQRALCQASVGKKIPNPRNAWRPWPITGARRSPPRPAARPNRRRPRNGPRMLARRPPRAVPPTRTPKGTIHDDRDHSNSPGAHLRPRPLHPLHRLQRRGNRPQRNRTPRHRQRRTSAR
ncbi:MAG: toll/interleukin-1 receptor domain-containing protein [Myxococcales bacterium]|nr:toll/interleukin-1 receptor domain-containing protein [Myxococcales bacterium]